MSKLSILLKMISHCRPWWIPFADRLGWLAPGRHYLVTYRGVPWRARGGVGDFAVLNEMFLHGSYDRALQTLTPGSSVVDIGANIGAFAIAAAHHGAAVVWAFEPVPANAAQLRDNITQNKLSHIIRPFSNAVAREAGSISFYTRETDAGGGTIHPEIHRSWHDARGAIAADVRKIEVQCVTLADFFVEQGIKRCDLLKLDCEGAEFDILSSLTPEVARSVGAIVFEYHSDGKVEAIIALLKGFGFGKVTRHPVYQVVLMTRA